jgi:protein SMG9
VFRVQSFEKQMLGEHCTNGVTAWMGPRRVLFLDCQPMNSASVLDRSIHAEKRYPAEFTSPENSVELLSLQFAAFLFNVCHVVLLVQDAAAVDPGMVTVEIA